MVPNKKLLNTTTEAFHDERFIVEVSSCVLDTGPTHFGPASLVLAVVLLSVNRSRGFAKITKLIWNVVILQR